MFHWFGVVQNTRGDALGGWQVGLVEVGTQTVVPIFSDENGTPIATVSGVANRAVADENGNYDFFVPSGTYTLQFYNSAGVFQRSQRFVAMFGADFTTGLIADLASNANGEGAALIGTEGSGTVQDFITNRLALETPATPGAPGTHWTEYFGNAGTAKVSRAQRLLVGVSAASSSERPNTTPSWVETYFTDIEADSTLISTSALGSLAISGVSRTSDFRTWTGGTTGGAQGVSGFALNDDTGGPGIAVGVFGEAMHLENVNTGITEAAEFVVCSRKPVVEFFPRGIVSGTTFCLNLSVGFRPGFPEDISCFFVFGAGFNNVLARKGFVAVHSNFDKSVGSGGAGVLGDMPSNMSLRWLNITTDAVEGELWMDPTAGLTLIEPAWRTYTPAITASSGTITTLGAVSGRYKKLGRTLHVNASATITTNGTAAGVLLITLPPGMFAAANTVLAATTSNGDVCVGLVSASSDSIACYATGFTYPLSDGEKIEVSGTIELTA